VRNKEKTEILKIGIPAVLESFSRQKKQIGRPVVEEPPDGLSWYAGILAAKKMCVAPRLRKSIPPAKTLCGGLL